MQKIIYAAFKLLIPRRLHDALLTRLSNDDDPERNLSTFSNEMASSAMILSDLDDLDFKRGALTLRLLGLATKESLILVDELGRWAKLFNPELVRHSRRPLMCVFRGTSTVEGLSIAHAIAERLIDLRASLPLLQIGTHH